MSIVRTDTFYCSKKTNFNLCVLCCSCCVWWFYCTTESTPTYLRFIL